MTFTEIEMETAAINSIRYYLNVQSKTEWTDEYIKTNFPLAIKKIVEDTIKLDSAKRIPGIKTVSEGNRAYSFGDDVEVFTITGGAKALLPRPYIVGW